MRNDYVKMGGTETIRETIERSRASPDASPIVRKEIAATKKRRRLERSSIDQRTRLPAGSTWRTG